MHFILKVKQKITKENLRGVSWGIAKNWTCYWLVFCNLVTSEHRIKFLKQWDDDNVEKNWLNESWHYDHYVWMWQNLLLMILMMIYEHLKVFWFLQSDCVGWSWSFGSPSFFFKLTLSKCKKKNHRVSEIFSHQCQGHALISVKVNGFPVNFWRNKIPKPNWL